MKRILFALLALVTLAFASCGKEENSTNNQPVIPPANSIDSYLGKWNLGEIPAGNGKPAASAP